MPREGVRLVAFPRSGVFGRLLVDAEALPQSVPAGRGLRRFGTDPVATRHPARRETQGYFRPIG
jgi:hypothetical protein